MDEIEKRYRNELHEYIEDIKSLSYVDFETRIETTFNEMYDKHRYTAVGYTTKITQIINGIYGMFALRLFSTISADDIPKTIKEVSQKVAQFLYTYIHSKITPIDIIAINETLKRDYNTSSTIFTEIVDRSKSTSVDVFSDYSNLFPIQPYFLKIYGVEKENTILDYIIRYILMCKKINAENVYLSYDESSQNPPKYILKDITHKNSFNHSYFNAENNFSRLYEFCQEDKIPDDIILYIFNMDRNVKIWIDSIMNRILNYFTIYD